MIPLCTLLIPQTWLHFSLFPFPLPLTDCPLPKRDRTPCWDTARKKQNPAFGGLPAWLAAWWAEARSINKGSVTGYVPGKNVGTGIRGHRRRVGLLCLGGGSEKVCPRRDFLCVFFFFPHFNFGSYYTFIYIYICLYLKIILWIYYIPPLAPLLFCPSPLSPKVTTAIRFLCVLQNICMRTWANINKFFSFSLLFTLKVVSHTYWFALCFLNKILSFSC